MPTVVRPARPEDAAACAGLYAPYVLETAVTFETVPPDGDELARRIAAAHVWLVAEVDGEVVGFASAVPWKTRAAYARTCETGVYVAQDVRGGGVGSALYDAMLATLRERGFTTVVTGVAGANPASSALHRRFGFEPVGTLRRVGWKLGAWHDVTLHQVHLD